MIQVTTHDPAWRDNFAAESTRLAGALQEVMVQIHHIGSTAIPGIKAKPVIDILVEVTSLQELDWRVGALTALNYEAMGEFGIPDRRYFRRNDSAGTRSHQVHAFVQGSHNVTRHLAFRDYMRAHPDVASVYGELKARLAAEHDGDNAAYVNGKSDFVAEHVAIALTWWAGREGT